MEPLQLRLPGFLPPPTSEVPLIPVRMLNEYIYCPRLAYLMWTQKEWVESSDTIEGKDVHKRVDKKEQILLTLGIEASTSVKAKYKSVTLSSEKLGIIAKMDVVEIKNRTATPVDYKRGKRPHVEYSAYLPERIQVCAQGMLLEEQGFEVECGYIYFAGSRERVEVKFDDVLRTETESAIGDLRMCVMQGLLPPPLRDSPKCPRCALVTICLPDEINTLLGSQLAPRPIAVPRDEALPLVIQSQRARVSVSGETLVVSEADKSETVVRLIDVSDVAIFGNVSITAPALSVLFDREIPISYHSTGGWFKGISHGIGHKNVEVRTAQYRFSFNEIEKLAFSKDLVSAKILNQRTMIRRNFKAEKQKKDFILDGLSKLRRSTSKASNIPTLLGIEGNAAAMYFGSFSNLLDVPSRQETLLDLSSENTFKFQQRNRRPPTDPINAMLSFGYAILARQLSIALATVGLDPFRGFFHSPRYGRPSLALDIMEPFRPIIVDSIVLRTVNSGEIAPKDFVGGDVGVALTQHGRRKFLRAYERRMSDTVGHPLFGYKLSIRRMLLVQARLLSRYLLKEIPQYPHYLPR